MHFKIVPLFPEIWTAPVTGAERTFHEVDEGKMMTDTTIQMLIRDLTAIGIPVEFKQMKDISVLAETTRDQPFGLAFDAFLAKVTECHEMKQKDLNTTAVISEAKRLWADVLFKKRHLRPDSEKIPEVSSEEIHTDPSGIPIPQGNTEEKPMAEKSRFSKWLIIPIIFAILIIFGAGYTVGYAMVNVDPLTMKRLAAIDKAEGDAAKLKDRVAELEKQVATSDNTCLEKVKEMREKRDEAWKKRLGINK